MKPLYPPQRKVRRSPLPMLLLIFIVALIALGWFLSTRAREQPLKTIEVDVSANAATH